MPNASGAYTKTVLDERPLFADGAFQLPPASTVDDDVYHADLPATSTEQAMAINSTVAGRVDGIWFVGFYCHSDGIVSYVSGAMPVDLINCRFVGNIVKATKSGATVQNGDTVSTKNLVSCRFMYATAWTGSFTLWGNTAPICVYRGTAGLTLTDCEFLLLFAENCEFLGNHDTVGVGGEGVFTVTDSVFRYNASSDGKQGRLGRDGVRHALNRSMLVVGLAVGEAIFSRSDADCDADGRTSGRTAQGRI